jgi:RNA polymerase sigma factor (TIGR02999 family)
VSETRPPSLDELISALPTSPEAGHRVFSILYDELRAIAGAHLRDERVGHSLQATALVHEAFIKLVGQRDATIRGREHFLALAATAIRRILVDHARARHRDKRGGHAARLTLSVADDLAVRTGEELDLVALDEALVALAELDERQARVVELRFFGGLSAEAAGLALGVSTRTVEGDWAMARAWLRRWLSRGT